MARIADNAGINVNSISKYLDELTSYYQVLERRIPVTEHTIEFNLLKSESNEQLKETEKIYMV